MNNILQTVTKGFDTVKDKIDGQRGTDLEKKVKEATSIDNWGASSTLKNDIARATFDYMGFKEVMPVLWKRMGENARNWRIIYKASLLYAFSPFRYHFFTKRYCTRRTLIHFRREVWRHTKLAH